MQLNIWAARLVLAININTLCVCLRKEALRAEANSGLMLWGKELKVQ